MAPSRCRVGLESSICLLLILVTVWQQCEAATVHRMIAIQFLSYSNPQGQLLDGSCCDGQSTGTCIPDQCDTAFTLCFKHQSNATQCDPQKIKLSPILNKNTISKFGVQFGGTYGNESTSLLPVPISTMEDIRIELDVLEVDETNTAAAKTTMGNFSMLLNYTNLFTLTPSWDSYPFDNGVVRLQVNVTSYCANHYYGSQCDVFCRHTSHSACDDSGNLLCDSGWTGQRCTLMIDYCISAPCQGNATCSPVLNSFNCTCGPGFTGPTCTTAISFKTVHNPEGKGPSTLYIVLPIVLILLLIAGSIIAYFIWRRKKNKVEDEPEKEQESSDDAKDDGMTEKEPQPYKQQSPKVQPEPPLNTALDF